jgi:hypothetical protein
MSWLETAKYWLVDHTHLAKDALHIYVALTLFLGAMLVFRWRVGSWKPLAIVLVAAIAGEAWDLRDSVVFHTRINLWANWHDIWNTMFWPSVITLLARWTQVFARSGDRGEQPLEQPAPVDPAVR